MLWLCDSYQKSRHFQQMGYEEDFMRFLQTLVADVEKRIRRGHARLALNNAAQQNSVNVCDCNVTF